MKQKVKDFENTWKKYEQRFSNGNQRGYNRQLMRKADKVKVLLIDVKDLSVRGMVQHRIGRKTTKTMGNVR